MGRGVGDGGADDGESLGELIERHRRFTGRGFERGETQRGKAERGEFIEGFIGVVEVGHDEDDGAIEEAEEGRGGEACAGPGDTRGDDAAGFGKRVGERNHGRMV